MTKQIPINFKSLATRLLVVFIMCLPLWSSKSYSQEAESYVVLNTTDGTLTFKHDTEKPSDAYSLNYGYNFGNELMFINVLVRAGDLQLSIFYSLTESYSFG